MTMLLSSRRRVIFFRQRRTLTGINAFKVVQLPDAKQRIVNHNIYNLSIHHVTS